MLSNFLTIPVREKIKVKLALAIPTGAQIDTPPVVSVKTIKILSM